MASAERVFLKNMAAMAASMALPGLFNLFLLMVVS
jgi:hypothetical protein